MIVQSRSRREFLVQVGRGMFVASIGGAAVRDLGLAPSIGGDGSGGEDRLTFGPRDRLVALVAETPEDRLLPLLVEALRAGTELQELVVAAALSNARAFGGEDYVGFHTFMALAPALRMAGELPAERRALPVLKVLYRNAARLQAWGGAPKDVLRPVAGVALPEGRSTAEVLHAAVRSCDLAAAETALATATGHSASGGWNDLLGTVHEALDVHRIVLAHRAWDMAQLAGLEHAHTLLRQSLHYCVRREADVARPSSGLRELLPQLLEEHDLLGRAPGARSVDDAWIDTMSRDLFDGTAEQAARAVAAALADDIAPAAVSEAIALAANQLMLRDAGRIAREVQPGKPIGSVHGDSIGIHACDSAHAWCHVARASDDRNSIASLILAGYQVAQDRVSRGGSFLEWTPRPHEAALANVAAVAPDRLLADLDGAIRANDQDTACAVAQRYLDLAHPPRPAFDLLLDHAIRADGALHAEKFFWTTSDEFARARPAFRSRYLVALARASASQWGADAPGFDQARELLGL